MCGHRRQCCGTRPRPSPPGEHREHRWGNGRTPFMRHVFLAAAALSCAGFVACSSQAAQLHATPRLSPPATQAARPPSTGEPTPSPTSTAGVRPEPLPLEIGSHLTMKVGDDTIVSEAGSIRAQADDPSIVGITEIGPEPDVSRCGPGEACAPSIPSFIWKLHALAPGTTQVPFDRPDNCPLPCAQTVVLVTITVTPR